jgi:hypothetical protein
MPAADHGHDLATLLCREQGPRLDDETEVEVVRPAVGLPGRARAPWRATSPEAGSRD